MSQISDIYVNKEDLGKNLYRKKTYYTLCVEQDVLAKNQDEADKKFSDCGIDYGKINKEIADEKNGVENYMVDANDTESGNNEYFDKVYSYLSRKGAIETIKNENTESKIVDYLKGIF